MCHDLFYSSLNRHSNILQVLAKKQQFRSRKHWARNWLQPLWNKVLWPRSLKELIRNPLKSPWLRPVSWALTVLTNTSALEREGGCVQQEEQEKQWWGEEVAYLAMACSCRCWFRSSFVPGTITEVYVVLVPQRLTLKLTAASPTYYMETIESRDISISSRAPNIINHLWDTLQSVCDCMCH